MSQNKRCLQSMKVTMTVPTRNETEISWWEVKELCKSTVGGFYHILAVCNITVLLKYGVVTLYARMHS
jgi:hypothetical protein